MRDERARVIGEEKYVNWGETHSRRVSYPLQGFGSA